MAQQQITASIFDVHLHARKSAVALFAVIAAVLTIASPVHAQTLTVLHTFNGPPDGSYAVAGPAMDAAGNVYGTTLNGGAHNKGFVFKVAHRGSGWLLTPLYSFLGGLDGSAPLAGVTIGRDGNLYGTASSGGQHGAGVVYKLSPPPSICRSVLCPWTETVLYQFTGGADGGEPAAAVIFDSAGNLFGTAASGGTRNNGVVFKLTPSGSGWTESVLYTFAGSPDGNVPLSALTFDTSGNLYGTTNGGGSGSGTVYQLTPSGSGWTEKILYAFQGSHDGANPTAGVVLDPEGNLYGATFYSGPGNGGTIFELTPSGGNWIFNALYSPVLQGFGGVYSTLARSSGGILYGALLTGGITQDCSGYGCGEIFQLSPFNGGWVYTSLYQFTGGSDGAAPYGGVILDSAGNLYGTDVGLQNDGNVFEITP